MYATHCDNGGSPVDDDRETYSVGGWEAPRVWVGSEGWEFTLERNYFSESRCAISVSDVTTFSGFHHIATAPEVVESVVYGNGTNAVLISEFDTSFDRVGCHSLTEFLFRIPNFSRSEARRFFNDGSIGCAAANF